MDLLRLIIGCCAQTAGTQELDKAIPICKRSIAKASEHQQEERGKLDALQEQVQTLQGTLAQANDELSRQRTAKADAEQTNESKRRRLAQAEREAQESRARLDGEGLQLGNVADKVQQLDQLHKVGLLV